MKKIHIGILLTFIFALSSCNSDEYYKETHKKIYENDKVKVYVNESEVKAGPVLSSDLKIFEDNDYSYHLNDVSFASTIVLMDGTEKTLNVALDEGVLSIDEILDLHFKDNKITKEDK